jgi:hypothetical protein
MLAYNLQDRNLEKISNNFANQMAEQCFYRFSKQVKDCVAMARSSNYKDIQLLEFVESLDPNWVAIANKMFGMYSEEIKQRFIKLITNLRHSRFDKVEVTNIIKSLYKYKQIAKYFPDRNIVVGNNEYYSKQNKNNINSIAINVNDLDTSSNCSTSNNTPIAKDSTKFKSYLDAFKANNSPLYLDNGYFKEKILNENFIDIIASAIILTLFAIAILYIL